MSLAPIAVLDAESDVFPKELLDECESALLLFCSGRMGAADGHWVREAGLTDVTAVDWDEKTLAPFERAYPVEWDYVEADAFEWAARQLRRWDLVSADVPSQYADLLAQTLPLWCKLAKRFVTVTVVLQNQIAYASGEAMLEAIRDAADLPGGWAARSFVWRAEWQSRHYAWLTLEHEQ